ncbi:hypothetical protein [Ottowia thiooxydans]|uniref:hypothetical protein n=1 Tax=Ottowia thiooxydans TaxID=219182 RepID=UPI0003FB9661|nr:hypothetical protein [Ottowia thiooxydans]
MDGGTALALSLSIEAPIVWIAGRRTVTAARLAVASLLPTVLTHPFAWRSMANFGAHDYSTGLLLVEALVVLAETALLWLITRQSLVRSLCVAVAANAASAALGMLL